MAKAYPISDRESLYLWVTPSGGKIWRWRYRLNSKEKLMTCGKYPAVSLGLARERHAEARKALALGIDPMAKRRTEKTAEQVVQADSFASIATRWLDHWKEGKSERHVDSTRRRLASNILPTLGLLKITEIEAPDVVGMVRTVEARGARGVAKRALETTGQILRFAIAHGYAKRNPATEIKPRRAESVKQGKPCPYRHQGACRAAEANRGLPRNACYAFGNKAHGFDVHEPSELIEARWSEFVLDESRWNIPAYRMKMRTPHTAPLSTQALATLEALRTISGDSEYLFPGDRDSAKTMSNNTILKALERMGYKGLTYPGNLHRLNLEFSRKLKSRDLWMKKSRFSEEQLIGVLKQGEAGVKTADLCREHGISAATFYGWKQTYGGWKSPRRSG